MTLVLIGRSGGSAWPQHMNKVVAETAYANIQKVGMPKWSDADQAFAKAVQRSLKVPERGLGTGTGRLGGPVRPEDNRGGGSDDIGASSTVKLGIARPVSRIGLSSSDSSGGSMSGGAGSVSSASGTARAGGAQHRHRTPPDQSATIDRIPARVQSVLTF